MNGVQLLLVVVGAIAVTAFAQRKGLESSLVIVVVACLVSFIPGIPRLELEPDIILGVVLPPLLYSTALKFSFFSFMQNLRPILALGIGLVVLTAFVVGFSASFLVPGLPFASALLLGAIVAPPDAVTAVAIGRKLGLPKRMMAILTGESLVNDAAALTMFSITAAAIAGTHTLINNSVLLFLYNAIVGWVIGIFLGGIVQAVWVRLRNPALETVLGLVVPFAAYLLAEQVEASGVLAVVMAGFALGFNSGRVSYATRLQERQVWDSVDVLLEAFVFSYMGLQMRFVIEDLTKNSESPLIILGASLVILAIVMLVRPLGVFPLFGLGSLPFRLRRKMLQDPRVQERMAQQEQKIAEREEKNKDNPRAHRRPRVINEPLTWQQNLVISWTGMRGVVTLAAAAGAPVNTPGREAILAIAFVVAVGTLLIQGTTLPWLISKLDIADHSEVEYAKKENDKAQEISRKAFEEVVAKFVADPPPGVSPEMLARFQQVANRQNQTEEANANFRTMGGIFNNLRQDMLKAQRAAILKERDFGRLDDEVAREYIEQLDYQEAAILATHIERLS